MKFADVRELSEKGKIGDTAVVNGQIWVQTGTGIGDILMKPAEGDTERRVLRALSKITGESRESLAKNDPQLTPYVEPTPIENDILVVRTFEKNWRTIWVGSEQREDAEWYTVAAFILETNAKAWMYEASNRGVEEVELKDAD